MSDIVYILIGLSITAAIYLWWFAEIRRIHRHVDGLSSSMKNWGKDPYKESKKYALDIYRERWRDRAYDSFMAFVDRHFDFGRRSDD